jgi:hypothetical protein
VISRTVIGWARTWFFLDLVSSLPLDYVFLFFDYNVVDGVGLVSLYQLPQSIEQRREDAGYVVFVLSNAIQNLNYNTATKVPIM